MQSINITTKIQFFKKKVITRLPLVREIQQSICECKNEMNLIDERFNSIFENSYTKNYSNSSTNQGKIRRNKKDKNKNIIIKNSLPSIGFPNENGNDKEERKVQKNINDPQDEDRTLQESDHFLNKKNLNEKNLLMPLKLYSGNSKKNLLVY